MGPTVTKAGQLLGRDVAEVIHTEVTKMGWVPSSHPELILF